MPAASTRPVSIPPSFRDSVSRDIGAGALSMGNGMFSFPQAPDRARALGEIHSRPYVLVKAPRVIFQLAFMMDGGAGVDHAVMAEMSRQRGVTPPGRDARHHAMAWGPGTLRWEQH